MELDDLCNVISSSKFKSYIQVDNCSLTNEVTVIIEKNRIFEFCLWLKQEVGFEQLIDIAGIDYLHYGISDWQTKTATKTGFSRGVSNQKDGADQFPGRFAVAYHLLSLSKNIRVRLKAFLSEDDMVIDSIVDVWPAANWFEREAFDLFGVLFKGHPDLRRLLTDYGFIGYPFRKDFPLTGNVEVKYDEELQRVVYQPVSIEPRTLVPKTIRVDEVDGECQ